MKRENNIYVQRAKATAKTKPLVDDIVKTLSSEEQRMLGVYNDEYLAIPAGGHVIKRFLKISDNTPVAFFDLFEEWSYIDVAVATRNDKNYRGHGYALNLAQSAIKWYTAHRSDFDNKPLLWITRKDNMASNQLALKIGMHPDDTYNKSNEVWNCYRYS